MNKLFQDQCHPGSKWGKLLVDANNAFNLIIDNRLFGKLEFTGQGMLGFSTIVIKDMPSLLLGTQTLACTLEKE